MERVFIALTYLTRSTWPVCSWPHELGCWRRTRIFPSLLFEWPGSKDWNRWPTCIEKSQIACQLACCPWANIRLERARLWADRISSRWFRPRMTLRPWAQFETRLPRLERKNNKLTPSSLTTPMDTNWKWTYKYYCAPAPGRRWFSAFCAFR